MARLPLISPLDRALFLKAQPYLQSLSPNAILALAQHTEECHFSAGADIYPAGTRPTLVHFLSSGLVRTEYEGREPADLETPVGIGLIEYFADSDDPPRVWAVEATDGLVVDVNGILQILEDDIVMLLAVAMGTARAARDSLAKMPGKRRERGFEGKRLLETFTTLDLVHRLALAREAPFFRDTNLTVLTQLLRFQKPQRLGEGEVLWRAGSRIDSMVLIVDGLFESRGGNGSETLWPAGSMLGGWEIFTQRPRAETARALAPSRIIEIDRVLFSDLLEDHFEFALDYLGKLARRVIQLRFPRSDGLEDDGGVKITDG